jgi:hypothetical protein
MAVTAVSGISDNSGVLTFVAPTGGVTKLIPLKIQNVIVTPLETASATASFQGLVSGGSKVLKGATKKTGAVWVVGQQLYFEPTNGFQTTSTGATAWGIAASAQASGDTTGDVLVGVTI